MIGLFIVLAALAGHGGTSIPFSMNGARLGMSLDAWRALPPPGEPGSHVVTECAPAPPRPQTPSAHPPMECRYVGRYGRFALPEAFPLSRRYLVRNPSFEFVDGRLASIRFQTSIDAFDTVMADLKRAYGPPTTLSRGSTSLRGYPVPRVTAAWTTAGARVTLTDPSPNPDRLEITVASASGLS